MTEPILLDEQLCFEVYQAHKAFNHFYAQALAPFHLTYAQYIVLLVLFQEEKISVKELGQHVGLDSGTLTPLLKRLEKDGWIKRERSQADERRLEIGLTTMAQRKKKSIFEHVRGCVSVLELPEESYRRMMTDVAFLTNQIDHATEKLS
ncbi:MAG: MarR family transcriptional regulator [Lactobacillaceae bacterium]|jgi:MarR family transcriptional regulator|nr:MarR family transcriptional regulator [Lactobacillaceae bacterium]